MSLKISFYSDILPFCFVTACTALWIFSSRPEEHTLAKNFLKKIIMYVEGILFMVLSKDSKGLGPKKNPDPDKILLTGQATVVKRVIFIRHGESEWNSIFNKGLKVSSLTRLIVGLFREMLFMITMDSVFIDSQLNQEGIDQAQVLAKYLESDEAKTKKELEIISIIRGDIDTSVIVSSNLRRAIATTTIALWPRISKSNEKIVILSSLQEISRNIDTKAVSTAKTVPALSNLVKYFAKIGSKDSFNPERVYDVSENSGNKTSSFYGIKRLKAFGEWVFKRPEDAIIVGGHSLWFKYFFQTFLPFKSNHDAKTMKIENSGVVSFLLHRAEVDGVPMYRIDPDSIINVYGGFTKK